MVLLLKYYFSSVSDLKNMATNVNIIIHTTKKCLFALKQSLWGNITIIKLKLLHEEKGYRGTKHIFTKLETKESSCLSMSVILNRLAFVVVSHVDDEVLLLCRLYTYKVTVNTLTVLLCLYPVPCDIHKLIARQ